MDNQFPVSGGQGGNNALISRETSAAKYLRQSWDQLSYKFPDPPSDEDKYIAIESVSTCQIEIQKFIVIEVVVPPEIESIFNIPELEEALSNCASEFAANNEEKVGGTHLHWTGRYLLAEEGEEELKGWGPLTSDVRPVEFPIRNFELDLRLGWGNGSIRPWSFLEDSEKWQIVMGLVDAQYIWVNAHAVSSQIRDFNYRITKEFENPERSKDRSLGNEISAARRDLMRHKSLYDDIIENIQGLRRASGQSLLAGWGYDRYIYRLDERLSENSKLKSEIDSNVNQKYMRATEFLLGGLSALSIFDIGLNVVSATMSADAVSEQAQEARLFYLARQASPYYVDIVIALALVAAAGLILVFGKRIR